MKAFDLGGYTFRMHRIQAGVLLGDDHGVLWMTEKEDISKARTTDLCNKQEEYLAKFVFLRRSIVHTVITHRRTKIHKDLIVQVHTRTQVIAVSTYTWLLVLRSSKR